MSFVCDCPVCQRCHAGEGLALPPALTVLRGEQLWHLVGWATNPVRNAQDLARLVMDVLQHHSDIDGRLRMRPVSSIPSRCKWIVVGSSRSMTLARRASCPGSIQQLVRDKRSLPHGASVKSSRFQAKW